MHHLGQPAFREAPPRTLASLTVDERWEVGEDPLGDRRLEAEGCFVEALTWHLQIGPESADAGAERLDVVPAPDATHPRIHRHPYGTRNATRIPTQLPPPDPWLHAVNRALGGALEEHESASIGDEAEQVD